MKRLHGLKRFVTLTSNTAFNIYNEHHVPESFESGVYSYETKQLEGAILFVDDDVQIDHTDTKPFVSQEVTNVLQKLDSIMDEFDDIKSQINTEGQLTEHCLTTVENQLQDICYLFTGRTGYPGLIPDSDKTAVLFELEQQLEDITEYLEFEAGFTIEGNRYTNNSGTDKYIFLDESYQGLLKMEITNHVGQMNTSGFSAYGNNTIDDGDYLEPIQDASIYPTTKYAFAYVANNESVTITAVKKAVAGQYLGSVTKAVIDVLEWNTTNIANRDLLINYIEALTSGSMTNDTYVIQPAKIYFKSTSYEFIADLTTSAGGIETDAPRVVAGIDTGVLNIYIYFALNAEAYSIVVTEDMQSEDGVYTTVLRKWNGTNWITQSTELVEYITILKGE